MCGVIGVAFDAPAPPGPGLNRVESIRLCACQASVTVCIPCPVKPRRSGRGYKGRVFERRERISLSQTSEVLTAQKQTPEFAWLKTPSSVPLQQALRNLGEEFVNISPANRDSRSFTNVITGNRPALHPVPFYGIETSWS